FMSQTLFDHLQKEIDSIREAGLYKAERIIEGHQGARVQVPGREGVLNLCANNYLGLAGSQTLVDASKQALDAWGYGMASVRFICGTQSIHKQLERKLSE